MALDISSGLDYIHCSMKGNGGSGVIAKPSIAHRDLKTANILLKPGLICVIADFGLAISEEQDITKNDTIGTLLYTSPEFLMRELQSPNGKSPIKFVDYLMLDIFSFSLLLWEMLTVTDFSEATNSQTTANAARPKLEHKLPYSGIVSSPPEIKKLKKAVYDEGLRPQIKEEWFQSQKGQEVAQIMVDCWQEILT